MPHRCEQNSICLEGAWRRWDDLEASLLARGVRADQFRDRRVALIVDNNVEAFEAASLVASRDLDAMILGRERLTEGVRGVLDAAGFSLLHVGEGRLEPASAAVDVVAGRVSLLTSGTTGLPKVIAHSWDSLVTYRRADAEPRRWLLPYQVGTYAWFQVANLALFVPGQWAIPVPVGDPVAMAPLAATFQADAISSTPTYWRYLLMNLSDEQLRAIPLRQITLGGEIVDQAILDTLGALFPEASLAHIYATTEVGACIVVKDRRAGFAASLVDDRALAIRDGRLFVAADRNAGMAQRSDRWIDTGDRVEVRGDRVLFMGRQDSAFINVGGNKAYPADIESTILALAGVEWCRVRAVRSPLLGQMAEADVKVRASHRTVVTEDALVAHCAARLPEYAVPRFWNFVENIPMQGSLKASID